MSTFIDSTFVVIHVMSLTGSLLRKRVGETLIDINVKKSNNAY